jgi:hypothetical protein
LSALIRKSVQKEITGEYEVTEEKYEEVYEELANLTTTVGSINSNLEALRKENVDSGEFEDGLDTVIDRMEDLHVEKVAPMSKDLEMMAEMIGEDIDQIKRNLTEISPEELKKS